MSTPSTRTATAPPSAPSAPTARPTLVIVDDGRRAELVVVPPPRRPAPGDRLRHRGVLWTITGRRACGRVLVAQPLPR